MSSGGGGNYPGDGNSGGDQGGGFSNFGGGPQWRPHHYDPSVREDGQKYETPNTSPVSVLETYDPTGHIPPQNDKQLGVLIDYRFEHNVRWLGYENWNVSNTLPNNSFVDKIAKQRLLAHIIEHRSDLPTAYRELDLNSGTPKLDSVKITSYIINSLNNSNN